MTKPVYYGYERLFFVFVSLFYSYQSLILKTCLDFSEPFLNNPSNRRVLCTILHNNHLVRSPNLSPHVIRHEPTCSPQICHKRRIEAELRTTLGFSRTAACEVFMEECWPAKNDDIANNTSSIAPTKPDFFFILTSVTGWLSRG